MDITRKRKLLGFAAAVVVSSIAVNPSNVAASCGDASGFGDTGCGSPAGAGTSQSYLGFGRADQLGLGGSYGTVPELLPTSNLSASSIYSVTNQPGFSYGVNSSALSAATSLSGGVFNNMAAESSFLANMPSVYAQATRPSDTWLSDAFVGAGMNNLATTPVSNFGTMQLPSVIAAASGWGMPIVANNPATWLTNSYLSAGLSTLPTSAPTSAAVPQLPSTIAAASGWGTSILPATPTIRVGCNSDLTGNSGFFGAYGGGTACLETLPTNAPVNGTITASQYASGVIDLPTYQPHQLGFWSQALVPTLADPTLLMNPLGMAASFGVVAGRTVAAGAARTFLREASKQSVDVFLAEVPSVTERLVNVAAAEIRRVIGANPALADNSAALIPQVANAIRERVGNQAGTYYQRLNAGATDNVIPDSILTSLTDEIVKRAYSLVFP